MILSRYTLKNINSAVVSLPDEALFELPEKVLQFGTGVLLRGLPDYFIHKANVAGQFNGRIVVVKSTTQGTTAAFDRQDGLYTVCVRGLENGQPVHENIVNASISRVLNASTEWDAVLECAHNIQIQVIISNTTETGIQLVSEDVRKHPPSSFPGKLLAFLLERYRAFNGSSQSGMVILPTELIMDNGKKLQSIVLELAHLNAVDEAIIEWIEKHNQFCNSLVDRIVPGKPDAADAEAIREELGYTDDLLTVSEVYRLWAIEGDEKVLSILSFSEADSGVVIQPDINNFRELKLRMLNGTHTLSCAPAILAGFETVLDAMSNLKMSVFISNLMQNEIAPAIPYEMDPHQARLFGEQVLDRFSNPFIRHQWQSISTNYSSKLKTRCLPVLLQHFRNTSQVPDSIALSFAAYILFMRAVQQSGGKYYGELAGKTYLIEDDRAEVFYLRWQADDAAAVVRDTLKDYAFWQEDLTMLPGFQLAVTDQLNLIREAGMIHAIEMNLLPKVLNA